VTNDDVVHRLRTEYRDLVLAWDQARNDPRIANRLFKKHHRLYKALRESSEGREAITGLLDDPSPPVRLMAATHSLAWAGDTAVHVLESLEHEMSVYGMDAKYTLREFRKGTLNLDW
jgi:Domain of unknown function (DUF2019)